VVFLFLFVFWFFLWVCFFFFLCFWVEIPPTKPAHGAISLSSNVEQFFFFSESPERAPSPGPSSVSSSSLPSLSSRSESRTTPTAFLGMIPLLGSSAPPFFFFPSFVSCLFGSAPVLRNLMENLVPPLPGLHSSFPPFLGPPALPSS